MKFKINIERLEEEIKENLNSVVNDIYSESRSLLGVYESSVPAEIQILVTRDSEDFIDYDNHPKCIKDIIQFI